MIQKKLVLSMGLIVLLASCNNGGESTEESQRRIDSAAQAGAAQADSALQAYKDSVAMATRPAIDTLQTAPAPAVTPAPAPSRPSNSGRTGGTKKTTTTTTTTQPANSQTKWDDAPKNDGNKNKSEQKETSKSKWE